MNILDRLQQELSSDVVQAGESFASRPWTDWSGMPGSVPLALIRPRNTAEVSRALSICNEYVQPVVVVGGMTGLAGGATVQSGEVAISLERMHAIEELDSVSGTLTAQAGAILATVQARALDAGFVFGLDLGARGSCTIGGNLATNAGGNRVVKYGMARHNVLGIEAVLADGTIVDDLHKMLKNNSGYDLKDLFVGSEGTLGILTRAVLRLEVKAERTTTCFCGLKDFQALTALLRASKAVKGSGLSAFEVMWPNYMQFVTQNMPGLASPLAGHHAYYALLEFEGQEDTQEDVTTMLSELLDYDVVADASVAQSLNDAQRFWAIRDAPAEFDRYLPGYVGFDIAFAISDMQAAADECELRLKTLSEGMTVLLYGHLADGNLHAVVHGPHGDERGLYAAVTDAIYDCTRRLKGMVSAEHGIGLKRASYLSHSRSAGSISAMRSIKEALDPRNILNRQRVLTEYL